MLFMLFMLCCVVWLLMLCCVMVCGCIAGLTTACAIIARRDQIFLLVSHHPGVKDRCLWAYAVAAEVEHVLCVCHRERRAYY